MPQQPRLGGHSNQSAKDLTCSLAGRYHQKGPIWDTKEKDNRCTETIDWKIREVFVTFAARAIPSTVRILLCGQALVGSDGSLWRSRNVCGAIDMVFTVETGSNPWGQSSRGACIEYHQATHSMVGATAYRFRKWLNREEIGPIPEIYRNAWRAAQVALTVRTQT